MTSTTLLTIVMSAYNEQRYMSQAVQSLLKQTYTDFRLVIIDNASTDATGEIAERFAREDSRVTVIHNEKNDPSGYKLLDQIDTPYYMPIAAHDIHLPRFIECCIARLEADPRVVLAYSKSMFMKGEHGERIFGPIPTIFETMEMTPMNRVMFVAVGLIESYQQFGIYRTEALRQVRRHKVVAFDAVVLTELAAIGMFAMVDEPLFHLRQAPDWGDGAVYRRKHFPNQENGVKPFLEMMEAFLGIADRFDDPANTPLLRMALFCGCFLRHKWVLELFGESTVNFFAMPGFSELHDTVDRATRMLREELMVPYVQGEAPAVAAKDEAKAPAPSYPPDELCPCRSNRRFSQCHGDLSWIRQLNVAIPHLPGAATMLHQAVSFAKRGNIPLADLLVRSHLAQHGSDPDALALLGEIALKINLPQMAQRYFSLLMEALKQRSGSEERIAAVHGNLELVGSWSKALASPAPKYLLIKAWGYGFWSDVDHLMGSLLIAEVTGRIPVVHWGKNSLFGDPAAHNAFDLYFEPVSQVSLEELASGNHTFYPPKWHRGNLGDENVDKWTGRYSRTSGIWSFGRDEDVVVTDFHTPVAHLLPWIAEESPYAKMSWHEIYRHLFGKYLRLKPHLAASVEEFYDRNMRGRSWLGVHVRGSDKVTEQRDLDQLNQGYYSYIEAHLARNPELGIFLLTDSTIYLEEFGKRYGDRVLTIDAKRTDGQQGVHLLGHSGKEVGESVVFDCYLAAKCDYFIGNGGSNVSAAIGSLKSWEEGRYELLGRDLRSNINVSIHNW